MSIIIFFAFVSLAALLTYSFIKLGEKDVLIKSKESETVKKALLTVERVLGMVALIPFLGFIPIDVIQSAVDYLQLNIDGVDDAVGVLIMFGTGLYAEVKVWFVKATNVASQSIIKAGGAKAIGY